MNRPHQISGKRQTRITREVIVPSRPLKPNRAELRHEFAADPKLFDEASREHYAALYARPGAMHAGFEQFKAFDQDAIDNKAFIAQGDAQGIEQLEVRWHSAVSGRRWLECGGHGPFHPFISPFDESE
jgi:hypothetical protein